MTGGARARWRVEEAAGTAAAFHAREIPEAPDRRVWVHHVEAPALVLGSTQSPEVVDAGATAAAGIDVVRRRSGGGAVLVEPGGVVWVDVVVPPGDPLWDDDVGRAAHWLGRCWAEALGRCGVVGADPHEGPLVRTPWSDLVCFAGIGPGEVLVGGRKVVGTAQRRTRHGARFQCAALLRWDPAALVALLRLDPDVRDRAAEDLRARAAALPVPGDELVAALLAALPA